VFFHSLVITFTLHLKNAFLCLLTTNKVNLENSSEYSLGAVPYTSRYFAVQRRTGRQRLVTMAEKVQLQANALGSSLSFPRANTQLAMSCSGI